VHDDLRTFLDTNLPKEKKRAKMILGVADSRIASAINELFSITCQHTGVVPELLRGKILLDKKKIELFRFFSFEGLRLHFPNLVKGLTDQNQSKAQLGLGHAYSRAKVKFNVNRVDNMIIQSIALLDQLDKDINTFSMRIR
jgi:RNA processing factor Prp31